MFHSQAEKQKQPPTSTCSISGDSRCENVTKEDADLIVSDNTSAETVVHVAKKVKNTCQRRRPKSLSSPLKKKKRHKGSSIMSPVTKNKVGVFYLMSYQILDDYPIELLLVF